jgi:hypothetical protein
MGDCDVRYAGHVSLSFCLFHYYYSCSRPTSVFPTVPTLKLPLTLTILKPKLYVNPSLIL